MHIYNNAEKKSIEIKYIEEILKEKSIDCNLFKHINKTNCDSKIVEKKFKNYNFDLERNSSIVGFHILKSFRYLSI